MNFKSRLTIAFLCAGLLFPALANSQESKIIKPTKITKDDAAGMLFQRDDVTETTHPDGHETASVTSMASSDGKFHSGMYRSTKTRFEISEPYGVDEFMYFLSGSVNLISKDDSVMTVHAGEAITMPKEWTGTWDTDGFEKIWVIHSSDD
ncbi:MAG: cupin domain-containing protein [Gammaproteobacteria bacterium]|nr:cupin domain-containing protein [Gammaproteobacteria bacterium]